MYENLYYDSPLSEYQFYTQSYECRFNKLILVQLFLYSLSEISFYPSFYQRKHMSKLIGWLSFQFKKIW